MCAAVCVTETGAFIWDLLPRAEGREDILRAVLAEYEVSEDTARADIGQFLEKLCALNIL